LLSSEGESQNDFSGGGPQSESEPPRVLPACRARFETAGVAVAGVRRAGLAAGVRSLAAEAEVRAAEAVRPRIGSSCGGVQPSLWDKDKLLAFVSHRAFLT
jgi:hypothetical protein